MVDVGTALISVAPSALAVKVLGPTADYLGSSLNTWTQQRIANFNRVLAKAERKLGPDGLDRPGAVPPRVLKGVLEEGSFCDSELGAEYLGGILASARTPIGRDDRGAALVAVISRLSTYQLRAHYLIYAAAQRALAGEDIELGYAHKRRSHTRFYIPRDEWAAAMEFVDDEQDNVDDIALHVILGLEREQLIDKELGFGSHDALSLIIPQASHHLPEGLVVSLTPQGIELFVAAHGHKGGVFDAFLGQPEQFKIDPPLSFEVTALGLRDIGTPNDPFLEAHSGSPTE